MFTFGVEVDEPEGEVGPAGSEAVTERAPESRYVGFTREDDVRDE